MDLSTCKMFSIGDHPCSKRFDIQSTSFGMKVPEGLVVTLFEGCFDDTTQSAG